MWIAITLVILNILIFGALLFIFRCLDSAPKFQIPDDERVNNPTELADEESTKMSPWDYYISLRHKSWKELSEYEKRRMVLATHLILDEIGTFSILSEVEEFLKYHLPEIPESWSDGDGVLGGFREWQESHKQNSR